MSEDEYLQLLSPYIYTPLTRNAATEFKQCFLAQDNATLENVNVMMVTSNLFSFVNCNITYVNAEGNN